MNRAGLSTDNMKRECKAICAVAMLDQHKRHGPRWHGLRGLQGGSVCVSVCQCVSVFIHCVTYMSICTGKCSHKCSLRSLLLSHFFFL